ncbi:MAG: hypothetical protein ACXQTW_02990 [Candidatus Methanospirareceae archaeon]
MKVNCAYCGREFYPSKKGNIYCSPECRIRATAQRYGITEERILEIIEWDGEITQADLFRELDASTGSKKFAASDLLKVLISKGIINKRKEGNAIILELRKGGGELNEDVSVSNKDESPEEEVQETSEGIQESVSTVETGEVIEKLESLSDEIDLSEIEEAIRRVRLSNISERLSSLEDMINDLNSRVQRVEDLAERVANLEFAVKKLKEALLELIEAVRF